MPSLAAFVRELLPDWMRRKDGAGAAGMSGNAETGSPERRPAAPHPAADGHATSDKEAGNPADGR